MPGHEECGLIPATRELLKKIKFRPAYAFGDTPVTKDQARAILENEMENLGLNDNRSNKNN